MDRRFVCEACGMKWFVPAARPDRPDLVSCDGCGGELRRLEGDGTGDPLAGTGHGATGRSGGAHGF